MNNQQAEQTLRERFGDDPVIIIDMVERDAKGHPGITVFNKQFLTTVGEDSKIHIMILEFNRSSTLEITNSVISRTITRKKSSIRG